MLFWRENNNGASVAKADSSAHNSSFLPLPTTVVNFFSKDTDPASKVSGATASQPPSKSSGLQGPKLVHPQSSKLHDSNPIHLSPSQPHDARDETPTLPGKHHDPDELVKRVANGSKARCVLSDRSINSTIPLGSPHSILKQVRLSGKILASHMLTRLSSVR